MMQRRRVFSLLAGAIGGCCVMKADTTESQQQFDRSHVDWVEQVLKRMQTIKLGATRQTLLTVFTTEGGLSTGLQRTFVSRDCPYFKVNVEFQPVGRSDRDGDGRVTLVEGNEDIIIKLSPFYLEFKVMD
jgi:hypothetical protein